MNRGLFITFEGPDGAGKSTQIGNLKEYLDGLGLDTVFTREPGGTVLSEKIRDMLLDPDNKGMASRAEALLYAASRAELVEKVIAPALEQDKIVVCDRYVDSSVAYQGFGRGLGQLPVFSINQFATEDLMPDLTIMLMLGPEEGRARLDIDNLDRLESEGLDFHQKVLEGFVCVAEDNAYRTKVIDATLSIEEIWEEIKTAVDWRLKKRGLI
ncbi:MAG: dTMP kinase [Eubacterium sp.]|nr:dTMP kinase [Eubacterium sp.]